MTSETQAGTWVDVGLIGDFREAPGRASANGFNALVSVVDGAPYAVEDSCLHRGASLVGGVCHDGSITCPSHWWRYDLRTGELHGTPGQHLRTFACRVNGDHIEVLFPPEAPRLSMREMLLAHARAEKD